MRSILRRTRVRLALGVGTAFLLVATVASALLWLQFSRLEHNSIDASLSAQAQSLLANVQDANGSISLSTDPLPATTSDGVAVGVLLLGAHGKVLESSGPAPDAAAVAPAVSDAQAQRAPVSASVSARGQDQRLLVTAVDTATTLVVSRPLGELQALLLRLAVLLGAGVLLLTGVVSFLAYRLTGRAMGPVRAIASAARDISEHDLHRRLTLEGVPPDELGELVATFNDMLARLEAAFDSLQRFTADAAHELRAPLTVLRTELEVALRERRSADEYEDSMRVAVAEAEHLGAIADRLLTLARADAGVLVPVLRRVDLGDLVDETVARWRPVASTRGVALRSRVLAEGALDADPELLRRVLDNLIDNAVRHTPPGGESGLDVARAGDEWAVSVWDTGPGIDVARRATLFDRFSRGDAARGRGTGGAGLGLSLCRAIVGVHGGTIALEETTVGARLTVRLPAERATPRAAATPVSGAVRVRPQR